MTADEKRESLDTWRKRLKEIGTKARQVGKSAARGFGKMAEKLGSSGG
jgi:hypothetical protein